MKMGNTSKLLKQLWQKVEESYIKEQISSEHCLQAIMYMILKNHLDEKRKIFIEPSIMWQGNNTKGRKNIPDIVVVNDKNEIEYIFELKCKPHYNRIDYTNDIAKLFDDRENLSGKGREFVLFGPTRKFDLDKDLWHNLPKCKITHDTAFVFAVIGREDATAVKKEPIEKALRSAPSKDQINFYWLVGECEKPKPNADTGHCFAVYCWNQGKLDKI